MIFVRIWRDPAWKRLTGNAQRVYLLLLSQHALNYAGVQLLHERLWAKYSSDSTIEEINAGITELRTAGFVAVDDETEEILVRSFIRNDGLWKQPRMLGCALEDARLVESAALRRALAAELRRLPVHELGKTRDEVMALLRGAPEELEC